MLITFTVILWESAGTLSFTVGGTEWNIQGYMVYTVVLIVIGGTLFTHKVVNVFVRLMWKNNVAKRHFEQILCSIISRQN